MNREDFLMLNQNIVYFDSGATTLKPKILSEAISDYYNNYSANAHRGDYDISLRVDREFENTRRLVKELLNAKDAKEIVFTSGATDSLNKIINGFFKHKLKKGDEILLTKSEHASNILPWFELAEELGLIIRYIDLDENYEVKPENIKIMPNTKVISLAHVTNVVGDIRPIKEITKMAHENGIYVLIDGAQSVPHMKVDVKDLRIDFLAFSAHKMLGPTGLGIIYGKEEYLKQFKPTVVGGGMNASFSYDGTRVYNEIPYLLEAGTPNIASVIGFGKVIEYINNIGIENIHKHEEELKKYAVKRLKEIPNIKIYNENTEGGIVAFNYEGIFAQDLAIYLNKYNICVRAGNHCAKMLKDEIGVKNTCRASFYLYNTKEEIDYLVKVLKNENIKNEII